MVFLGLAFGILLVGCAKPAEKPLCMSGDVQVDTACGKIRRLRRSRKETMKALSVRAPWWFAILKAEKDIENLATGRPTSVAVF